MTPQLQSDLQSTPIIAVTTLDTADSAIPLAKALLTGGVRAIELTLRTPAALPALERLAQDVPELLIGAGTVLTPDQARQVKDLGVTFAVAPGMSRRVVETAREIDLPFAPGICTPSDIEAALELDCRCLKFFPAEPSGGLPFLNTMAAPYAHLDLRYIPLGGITAANAASYLENPHVLAIGGSWIAPPDAIRDRDWTGITERARQASALATAARS